VAIGTVSELYIHPVKSARGRAVDQIECGPLGGSNGEMKDRHFLVVEEKTNRFVTARQMPRLVLIECDVQHQKLTLSCTESTSPVSVNLDEVIVESNIRRAILHAGLHTDGFDCGDSVAEWLRTVLQSPISVRLIYYVKGMYTERTVVTDPDWWKNPVPKRNDNTAYADLAPYMAFSSASLDELHEHLQPDDAEKVSSRNFRPNIVISGCPPFDEDRWSQLRIGTAQFTCFKPCTRCVLTTVNPATGVKDPDMQPLKTLRQYRLAPEGKMRRKLKDSPVFGTNMGLDITGTIHIGDVVYARYKPTPF